MKQTQTEPINVQKSPCELQTPETRLKSNEHKSPCDYLSNKARPDPGVEEPILVQSMIEFTTQAVESGSPKEKGDTTSKLQAIIPVQDRIFEAIEESRENAFGNLKESTLL